MEQINSSDSDAISTTKSDSEYLTYDEALSKVSKKPLDRFQLIMGATIMCGITSFDWILFGM